MPTTSNFGWTTPADTDLVKDGAAAIRTLGNGVDASFVDLKGGTTGQVLSKASNTDLDYSWVTPNVGDITEVQAGTGISVASGTGPIPVVTNTVATAYDAKGDLIVGTGADTFAKLTVGTNGHTLVADSSETTGLKWQAPAGGGANWSLLNSGGTALTGAGTVTVSGISGKDQIMILVQGASSSSANAEIRIRFNTDTGSNYYVYGGLTYPGTVYASSLFGRNDGQQTYITLGAIDDGASTNSAVSGGLLLTGCNASGVKVFQSMGMANEAGGKYQQHWWNSGYYNSASTISSISVVAQAGNLDAGTVFVYTTA